MPTFKAAEMRVIDRVFGMESGWVLNFSDRTIADFFLDELNIDFNDPRYIVDGGTSKAKRLRAFLRLVDDATAIRTLRALLEYRTALYKPTSLKDEMPNAEDMLLEVIHRLDGSAPVPSWQHVPTPAAVPVPVETFKSDLMALPKLGPQARGYAFERFLIALFKAYGLNPHNPFRVVGEQIDGSFKLEGEFYPLEAKWQDRPTPAADLRDFHGKVTDKSAWTHGLFVSNSGFTIDGLQSFGRAKSIICMDGFGMWTMLERRIPLPEMLERKVRRAAERGDVFCSVRELF